MAGQEKPTKGIDTCFNCRAHTAPNSVLKTTYQQSNI